MNIAILAVTLMVALAMPAAMWAVFSCSKDVHQYSKHYASGGFSAELPDEEVELPQADEFASQQDEFANFS